MIREDALHNVFEGHAGIFVELVTRLHVLEFVFDPLDCTDLHTGVLGYLQPVITHS